MRLVIKPWMIRLGLNLYPPYLGAGVHVKYIANDWKEIQVSMPLRLYNRNIVKTHFGGSLYSMVDPHYMLMLMKLMGKDYNVWDKAAEIDFIYPGKRRVHCTFKISDQQLKEIQQHTAKGEKYFPVFHATIKDSEGMVVAKVKKTLYVRKKRRARIENRQ